MSECEISNTERARAYLGDGIPGDLFNAVAGIQMEIGDKEAWPMIKPAEKFEDYIRKTKLAGNPKLADAVMEAADKEKVEIFDRMILAINEAIGDGIKSEKQAADVKEALNKLDNFIYD